MDYHVPVLAEESTDALKINAAGIYVDATFGGGGHSALILQQLGDKGRLLGFDQDEDAVPNVPEDSRFTFFQSNFRYLKRYLRLENIREVDGILADLGVSSHQLDEAERGFSYRFDSRLDMRMNRGDEWTAADILNRYPAEELQEMFSRFGEVRNAKTLVQAIAEGRNQSRIETIGDLLALAEPLVRGQKQRYLSQVFQALRMEVNDEMGALEDFLQQSLEVLKPGGRLVIITYHSIEDRLVKNFLKTGNTLGEQEKDFYGNINRPFWLIYKKALLPSADEIRQNPRARSARLRAAEKNK